MNIKNDAAYNFQNPPCNVVFNSNTLMETPNQIISTAFSLFSGDGV